MARFLVEILISAAGGPKARAAYDDVGNAASAANKKIEASSLAAEKALRRTAEAADKLKDQLTETAAAKNLIADLGALNKRTQEQIAAFKGGTQALERYEQKQKEAAQAARILKEQVRAGVSAQSAAGKEIADQIRLHDKLQAELHQTRAALQGVDTVFGKSINLGAIAGALAGFYAIKTALTAITREVTEGEDAIAQLQAGILSTGGAAGKSASQLEEYAGALSRATRFDDEEIMKAQGVLLTFTKVVGSTFDEATRLAADLSTRLGGDLNSSITMVGKALQDPIKGVTALGRAGVQFSADQKSMIKELVETNQLAEAQRIILRELEVQVGGSAAAARDTLGGALATLRNRWGDLLQTVGESGSGPFRVGIEAMISLLESLTANWHILESATFDTIGSVIEGMADWADIFVGHIERMGRVLIWFAELDPFSNKRGTDWGKGVLDGMSSARQSLHDAAEGFKIKADEALDGAGKSAHGAAAAFKGLSTKTGGLSTQQKRAIATTDDLTQSISDLEAVARLYRLGASPEDIDNLKEAQKLTKQYLSDVEQYGERAARALRSLRIAESAAREEAEKAKAVWDLVIAAREKFLAPIAGQSITIDTSSLESALADEKKILDQINAVEKERAGSIAAINRLKAQGLITDEQANALLREHADLWVEVQSEAVLASEEFYRSMSARLTQVGDQVASILAGELVDALVTGRLETERLGDALRDVLLNTTADLIQQWLAEWFKAMAQWLVRWIATTAAAKTAQAGLGSTSIGSGGSVFGLGKGLLGNPMTSYGSGAGLGYAAGFAVVAAIAINWLKTKGTPWAKSVLNIGGKQGIEIGQGSYGRQGASGKDIAQNVQQTLSQAQSIITLVNDFIRSLGGQIDQSKQILGRMSIEKKGQGKSTQWIVTTVEGIVRNFGSDMEAAMQYAAIQALKATPTIGLSPEISTVIKNSMAETLDALQHDLAIGLDVLHSRLGQVGSQVYDAIRAFSDRVSEAGKLGLKIDSTQLSNDIDAIRNSLLGIDTSFADFLASLISFNKGIDESVTGLRSTLEDKLKKAQDQLAELLESGPQSFERPSGKIVTQTEEQWKAAIARLRESIADYLQELDKLPRKLSALEIEASVFEGLFKYFKGNKELEAKYGAEALKYARARLEIEFEIVKMKLMELGLWEKFGPMWEAARNAANAALEAPKVPRVGGGGGGSNRKEQREDLRQEIARMRAEAKGELHVALFDLNAAIADFAKRAKEAKLPAAEIAEAILLMTKKFQQGLREQAETLAGRGTDFTARLRNVQKFFDELKELGREKTGMPDWLVRLLRGEALAQLGTELQAAIAQFSGLVDPMTAINMQAAELRENILAYGQAAGWTAEQIAAAMAAVEGGIEAQRQQGINGLLDRLFSVLAESGQFEAERQEFERNKIELEWDLFEAQLRFYGAWTDAIAAMVDAAKAIQIAGITAGQRLERGTRPLAGPGWTYQDMADAARQAAQDWRAGIESFTQSTRDLLTDDTLSGLSQSEQLSAAEARFRELLAAAQGGDISALQQLAAAREEYLREARESHAGGYGYDAIWREVMESSAGLLANAQAGEAAAMQIAMNSVIANANSNTQTLASAIYGAAAEVAQAIYDSFNALPQYAEGGLVTRPHLAMVGEVPELITPLADLRSADGPGYYLPPVLPFRPDRFSRAPSLSSHVSPSTASRLLHLGPMGGRMEPRHPGMQQRDVRDAGTVSRGGYRGGTTGDSTGRQIVNTLNRLLSAQQEGNRHAANIARTNAEMKRKEQIRTAGERRRVS